MDLKTYLKENDCTIARAARALNITRKHLSCIVNGQHYPSHYLAKDIEKFTHGAIKWTDLVRPKKNENQQG